MEDLKKRVIEKIREQASEAFNNGYRWLFEKVDSGELDYDDLCTISICEDTTDIIFYFTGDYRQAILRLRKASPEFFEGVKKAVAEILENVRRAEEWESPSVFD